MRQDNYCNRLRLSRRRRAYLRVPRTSSGILENGSVIMTKNRISRVRFDTVAPPQPTHIIGFPLSTWTKEHVSAVAGWGTDRYPAHRGRNVRRQTGQFSTNPSQFSTFALEIEHFVGAQVHGRGPAIPAHPPAGPRAHSPRLPGLAFSRSRGRPHYSWQ